MTDKYTGIVSGKPGSGNPVPDNPAQTHDSSQHGRSLPPLKHVRRPRLIIAMITAIAMVLSMWALYDTEFHYANTEAGRQKAVSDYIPGTPGAPAVMVPEGTDIWATAYQAYKEHLIIFYRAKNRENVHGILHLIRGVNGKYRPVEASISPFPYTAGVYTERMSPSGMDWSPLVFAGDDCYSITSFRVIYSAVEADTNVPLEAAQTYTVPAESFLWLFHPDDIQKQLGLGDKNITDLAVKEIQFLDRNGNDITPQYQNSAVDISWNSGKGTAEAGLLYVFMGIVAFLGIAVVRYLILED